VNEAAYLWSFQLTVSSHDMAVKGNQVYPSSSLYWTYLLPDPDYFNEPIPILRVSC
jgi:hypothetical protein